MVHEARVKVTESIQATLCFRHPSSLRVNEALNGLSESSPSRSSMEPYA